MKNMIWITTQFEGFHRWINAPDTTKFLRELHRHLFKIKVYIEIYHNDREIEFFDFKEKIDSIINNPLYINKSDTGSCEMIANDIYDKIEDKYKNREILIEVSEDGENGCLLDCK